MIIWRKRSKVRNRCETEGIAASQMRDDLSASDMADFAGQMRKWDVRAPDSWQNPKSMLFYQTLKLVWIFREELFSPHNHLKALWVVVWFFYVTGNPGEFQRCALTRRCRLSQATARGARMCQGTFFKKKQGFMVLYENRDAAQIGGIPVFFI